MNQAIAEVTNVLEQSLNNGLLPIVVKATIIGLTIGVPILLLNKQPPAKPGVLHIRAKPWNTSLRVSSRKYDLPAAKNLLLAARKRA